MNVLIISDSSDLRVALQIALREEPNYCVIAAVQNSAGAHGLIHSEKADLVILDWDTKAPSPALLEAIRHQRPTPRTLALCADASSVEAATRAGMDACVLKYESPVRLAAVLRDLSQPTESESRRESQAPDNKNEAI